MKIVLVSDTFPPIKSSGAIQIRDLTREFALQGHDVTVIVPSADLAVPWQIENYCQAKIIRLRAPRIKGESNAKRLLSEMLMPLFMWYNLGKSPFNSERWDHVIWYSPSIFHGPLVRFLKNKNRCSSYLILRDIFPDWTVDLGLLNKGIIYHFLKWIERYQYLTADIIGVQSPGNETYFDAWSNKKKCRIEVLHNWLAPVTVASTSLKISESKLVGRKIFVYTGNMGVAQGLDAILDLAEQVLPRDDIGFLFVGTGTEVERLRFIALARHLDNVLFHDEIEPDEIPNLYDQCHVGIVSLAVEHKSHNIPGKFLNYMRSGLPVLAKINEGNDLSEMILENQIGQVCEVDDGDTLKNIAFKLLVQIENDPNISIRCRNLFEENFEVTSTVRQITSTLSGIQ